ncbi:MAG: hypothetical protein IJS08_02835 [Victivallales bacterium]|nr:hypothetical protein [Victivallales bacterium]
MMANIVLFCYANEKTAECIVSALARVQSLPAIEALPTARLNAIYADARAAINCELELLVRGSFRQWASALIQPFAAASKDLCADAASADRPCICLSPENSLYIQCWREACLQHGLGLRIVYVRDFSVFASAGEAALREFHCAVYVALQTVPGQHDIAVFDVKDLGEKDLDMGRLLLGEPVPVGAELFFLPAQDNEIRIDALPLELRLVFHMFKNLRMGAVYAVQNSLDKSRKHNFLEIACHPAAALAHWGGAPHVAKLSVDEYWRFEQRFAALSKVLDEALQRVQQMENVCERLREMQPYAVKAADVLAFMDGKTDVIVRQSESHAVESKVVQSTVFSIKNTQSELNDELTLAERKKRKFRRDPVAYFKDSKNIMFRIIGRIMQLFIKNNKHLINKR